MRKLLLPCMAIVSSASLWAAPAVPVELPFFTDFTQYGISEKFTIIDANAESDDILPFTWVIGTKTVDKNISEDEMQKQLDELKKNDPHWFDGLTTTLKLAAVYNGYRRSLPNNQPHREGDDYLITPAFQLIKDTEYTVTFTAASVFGFNISTVGCNIDVYLGNAPTIDGMKSGKKLGSQYDIPDYQKVLSDPSSGTFSYTFTADEDDIAYIGFHSVALADKVFWIDSILIEAKSTEAAPAEVSGLKAVSGERAAHEATISFETPTKALNGSELSSITKISVFRDGGKISIHNFDNPKTDATLSFTDKFEGVQDAVVGNHTYTVQCFNEKGNNEGVSTTVWVGEDFSASVRNLKVEELDTEYRLYWEKPVATLNGGYVDFDNLKYYVMSSVVGSLSTDPTEVGTTVNQEFFIPKAIYEDFSGQYVISFYVFPVSEAGMDLRNSVASTKIVAGSFYNVPYKESFAGGEVSTSPWTINDVAEDGQPYKAAWSYTAENEGSFILTSQDNDGGHAIFHNMAYPKYMLRLMSPKINVKDVNKPELTFYTGCVGAAENKDNFIQVEFYNGDRYIPACEPILVSGSGWTKHTVPLDNEEGITSYRLAFKASAMKNFMLLLDNIKVDATDGVEAIGNDDHPSVAVVAANGGIAIVGECDYAVYGINGVRVAEGHCADGEFISVAEGVYVVKAGESTFKCIVK